MLILLVTKTFIDDFLVCRKSGPKLSQPVYLVVIIVLLLDESHEVSQEHNGLDEEEIPQNDKEEGCHAAHGRDHIANGDGGDQDSLLGELETAVNDIWLLVV